MDDPSATLREYEPKLRELARRIHWRTGRRMPVEDLAQLGRIGLVRALDTYEPNLGPREIWLLKQAEWEMRMASRTERRQNRIQRMLAAFRYGGAVGDDEIERLTGGGAIESKAIAFVLAEAARSGGRTPEEQYCTEQAIALFPALRRQLPERQQKVLEMVYDKAMTVTDAAGMLGVDKAQVSRDLSKAHVTLRAMLDSPPPVPED